MLKKKAKGISVPLICEICKKKTNVLYSGKNGKKICKKCSESENNE